MNPRETTARLAGDVLWQASKAIRHEIVDPNHNLLKAREHLQEGGSLIVVINHFDRYDMMVIGHTIENHLTSLRNVAAITGLKHFDPTRHEIDIDVKLKDYFLINLGRKSRGFRVIRVVQRYDKPFYEKHPQALEGKSIKDFNRESLEKATELLQTPGQVLIFAPEGTRSSTGKLLRAQPGVEGFLASAKDKALVLPIGMVPPKEGKITPGKTRVKAVIGEPFSYEDLEIEHSQYPKVRKIDLIMANHLVPLLPPQNHGFYGIYRNFHMEPAAVVR